MMYSGQAAINFLATEISKEDSGESSHWQKYHSEFRFLGNGFEGLGGFGGNEKPYRGLRLVLNRLLQRSFRRMGVAFQKFNAIDSISKKVATCEARASDLDVLRQALTLSYLHERVPNLLTPKTTSCVIGDGFATMTTLLLASSSAGQVILINLTKTLLVDLWYLKLWMGTDVFESSVDLVTDEASLSKALAKSITNEVGGGGASNCNSGIEPRIVAELSGRSRPEHRINARDESSGHSGLFRWPARYCFPATIGFLLLQQGRKNFTRWHGIQI